MDKSKKNIYIFELPLWSCLHTLAINACIGINDLHITSHLGNLQAEDVIGSLLKEYLDELQPHGTSSDLSTTNGMVGGKGDGNTEENDTTTTVTDITTSDTGPENDCPKDKDSEQIQLLVPEQQFDEKSNVQEISKGNSNDNNVSGFLESSLDSSGFEEKAQEKVDFDKQKVTDSALRPQFKNIVAIVDPPRVGLHPIVSYIISFYFSLLHSGFT